MIRSLFAEDIPLEPLEVRILRHFERYRVSFLAASIRVVLDPQEQQNQQSRAKVERSIHELTERGHLLKLPGDSFLARTLWHVPNYQLKFSEVARTWFCCMESERRHLATFEEVKPLFTGEAGMPFHNFSHAVIADRGGPVLARIYQCNAEKKNAREQIRRHVTEKSKKFLSWIDDGTYRLAVLVQSDARKQEIETMIRQSYRAQPPLLELAGITVSVVPNEMTFEQMLENRLQGGQG